MSDPMDPPRAKEPPTAEEAILKSLDRTQKGRTDDGGSVRTTDPGPREGRSAIVGHDRDTPRAASSTTTPEETDLERRVLAHERILQTLIVHLAETEPAFLERLHQSFVESMRMVSREQNYTNTDAYAEEFIRTVARLRERPKPRERSPQPPQSPQLPAPLDRGPDAPDLHLSGTSPVFQIRERAGIWEVTVNGCFHGDYSKRTTALEAVRVLSSMAV